VSAFDFERGLSLAETDILICRGDRYQSYPCRVYFDLKRSSTILIEPLRPITAIADQPDGPFSVVIPYAKERHECFAVYGTTRLGGR
jgi:hypothetical protein